MIAILIISVVFISFFIAYGTFNAMCEFCDMPTTRTSRAMLQAYYEKVTFLLCFDVALTSISQTVVQLFRIRFTENKKLSLVLEVAEIHMEQEVYIIRPFIVFLFLLIGAIPLLHLHIGLFILGMLIGVLAAIYSYRYSYIMADRYRDSVESELPQFVQIAAQCYDSKQDCKQFLKIYSRIAGKELKKEIGLVLDADSIVDKNWNHMRERIGRKNFYPIHDTLSKSLNDGYVFLKAHNFRIEQKQFKYIKNRLHRKLFLSKLVLFLYLIFSSVAFVFYISKTLL